MPIFERLESEVRSYCRSFPAIFKKAKGHKVWSEDDETYVDFFSGAGALNYGHNDSAMQTALLEYIAADGITHGLDMATIAKERFLQRFEQVILAPRGLQYKVMFPGPTGTNAVECALKLARKVTGRETIISFTNAFHGMTLGSLSITGNAFKRSGAGVPLNDSVHMPYAGYLGDDADSLDYIERFLEDSGSGVSLPAAIILETVQGEGGLNAASPNWLRGIARICRRWGILLIVDDIQAGCGRTGPFFSFETSGIVPDIVCLSKSLSGYGLPLAITLFKPDLDIWEPGEHNGTFRGNNPAFVTATAALRYWEDDELERAVERKARRVEEALHDIVESFPALGGTVRGRGLMQGIACEPEGLPERICAAAFERGLIMETSGAESEVVKLLPPLTIDRDGLEEGLCILRDSVAACADRTARDEQSLASAASSV